MLVTLVDVRQNGCICHCCDVFLFAFFWGGGVFISSEGRFNTGAGRSAVSPQASGRFHRSQFKIKAEI